MTRLVAVGLILLVAFMLMLSLFQSSIIFPTHAVASPGPLPPGAERVSIDTPGREHLHGVHLPPTVQSDGPRTLVLGFGGNAWNAEDAGAYLHDLYPEAHVVAFHYRGYKPSTGRPSAEHLIADAPLVHEVAVKRVKPDRIVAVGFSIGSAVAASLPNRRRIDGLILVTPFDSLKAVASNLYPWLPVGLVFHHELNTVELLGGADVPVAIIAAEADEIIPPRRTNALRSAVSDIVYDRTIRAAGHNQLYARPEFQQAMEEALVSILSATNE